MAAGLTLICPIRGQIKAKARTEDGLAPSEEALRVELRSPRVEDLISEADYATDDGRHLILVGDCVEVLKRIPDESVDLVVTSPPYNIGIAYSGYADDKHPDDYLAWLRGIFVEIKRVLRPDGSFFLNIGAQSSAPWLAFDVARQAREMLVLQNHIIWAKSVSVGDDTFGHFKPINSPRYLNNTFEDIFHFTKNGAVEIDRRAIGVPFKYKSNIARFGHTEDKRCKGNIWFIPYETIQSKSDKHGHPAIYPVSLVEHCLRLHGLHDDTLVLDPFLGTGTTTVGAIRLGARSIGIELDPDYAAIAWERTSETERARAA